MKQVQLKTFFFHLYTKAQEKGQVCVCTKFGTIITELFLEGYNITVGMRNNDQVFPNDQLM